MEEFKAANTKRDNYIKSIGSVKEVQKDIKLMEDQKEQLLQTLSTVKRKVFCSP
jgi:hypothetical protein